MANDPVCAHCAEIERCNQRGGRMLSIIDLIEAGTFSRDLAAYALAAIGNGASFMVGALPGGAGKTTVMGALLNFVPNDVELVPADGMTAIGRGLAEPTHRRCFICHEIGSGHYYAYLWGKMLRTYFELPEAGHMLATNLHADTFEQAREQICGDNGVAEATLRRMNLCFFLAARPQRRIQTVWESDGVSPHRKIYTADPAGSERATRPSSSSLVASADLAQAGKLIDELAVRGARTIQDVRRAILKMRAAADNIQHHDASPPRCNGESECTS